MFYLIEKTSDGQELAHAFQSEEKYHYYLDGKMNSDSTFTPCSAEKFEDIKMHCDGFYHPNGYPRCKFNYKMCEVVLGPDGTYKKIQDIVGFGDLERIEFNLTYGMFYDGSVSIQCIEADHDGNPIKGAQPFVLSLDVECSSNNVEYTDEWRYTGELNGRNSEKDFRVFTLVYELIRDYLALCYPEIHEASTSAVIG